MDVEKRKPKKRRRLLKLFLLFAFLGAVYVGAARARIVHLSTPLDVVLSLGMTDHHGALLKPRDGAQHLVVMLHGMGRTHWSMWKAERFLERHGFEVWNETYDGQAMNIAQLAEDLESRLEQRLEGLGTPDRPLKLYGVAHSMGGLVLRAYLQRETARPFERLVFLGTPNRGAARAALSKDTWWYQWLFGKRASFDLVPGSPFFKELTPEAPGVLGNIIGCCGDNEGYSSAIPGDDDGRVGIEEAHLEGEADSILLLHRHSFLPTSADSLYQMLFFISHGRFDQTH